MANGSKVSVVVITHNRKKDVVECLRSLHNSTYSNLEIVVVDNNSADGTLNELKKHFPSAKVIWSEENLGGAGGRNLGIRNCSGEYIFFIDDDAVIGKDAISELLKVFESDAKVGIGQPKVYDYTERKRIQGIGHGISLRTGRPYGIGVGELDQGQYEQVMEIPMAGCCLMVKREVIERVGLFDETFFIPYEDSDHSLRARKAGYRIVFVPKARVWHKGIKDDSLNPKIHRLGISTPSRGYFTGRNRIIFMKKHSPYFLLFLFFLPLYLVRYGFLALRYRRLDGIKNFVRGSLAGLKISFSMKGTN